MKKGVRAVSKAVAIALAVVMLVAGIGIGIVVATTRLGPGLEPPEV